MTFPRRKRPHRISRFTLGSPADRWASIAMRFPVMRLRVDPAITSAHCPLSLCCSTKAAARSWGNQDASWWRDRKRETLPD
jgi:hypothetical protein